MAVLSTSYTLEAYDTAPIDWQLLVPSFGAQAIPVGTGNVTGLTVVPVTPPWPSNDTIIAESGGLAHFVTSDTNLTVISATATDNQDGTGATYMLTATVSAGLFEFFGAYGTIGYSNFDTLSLVGFIDNPTDHTIYLQAMTGTVIRFALVQQNTQVQPPVTPPPTQPPPPSNLPPSVVQRKLLDAANPGFNIEITRLEHQVDLVTLFLGDKINLTLDGVQARLGIINRSHVVTRMRIRWTVVQDGDVPAPELTVIATLEKIPGQLLGGAGTSSSDQDAAFDGSQLNLFGGWDAAGGWNMTGWAA